MSRWLTPEERELPRDERRKLRQARKRERWPDTDGRPPWVVRTGTVLRALAQDAAVALVIIAREAVLAAAGAALSGGRARHDLAVERVLEAARDRAIVVGREQAGELVYETFSALEDGDD